MKILIESQVECTVDGVGLLEPGKPVVVEPELFQMYHRVKPAEAVFPPYVSVTFDLDDNGEGE
jgi:hypothetical protein